MEDSITTSQAAAILDFDVETIRYWDKEQLLPLPARTPGKWRLIDSNGLCKVALMIRAVARGVPAYIASDLIRQSVLPLDTSLFFVIATFNTTEGVGFAGKECGPNNTTDFLTDGRFWRTAQVLVQHSWVDDASSEARENYRILGTVQQLALEPPVDVLVIDVPATYKRVQKAIAAFFKT